MEYYASPLAQNITTYAYPHWHGPFPTRASALWMINDARGAKLFSANIEGQVTEPYSIQRAVMAEKMTAAYANVPGDTAEQVKRFL